MRIPVEDADAERPAAVERRYRDTTLPCTQPAAVPTTQPTNRSPVAAIATRRFRISKRHTRYRQAAATEEARPPLHFIAANRRKRQPDRKGQSGKPLKVTSLSADPSKLRLGAEVHEISG